MAKHGRMLDSVFAGVLAAILLSASIGQAATTHKSRAHAVQHAKISAARANAIALKKYPGRIIGTTSLENENGVWQYAAMVRSGKTLREVMVNGKTGRIDSVEVTSSSKERKEAKAETAMEKSRHTAGMKKSGMKPESRESGSKSK